MFPVSAAEFTAEGTANNILINQYIPLCGCPRTMLSNNGLSSAPSFDKLYISSWACTSLLQALIIPTVMGASSG